MTRFFGKPNVALLIGFVMALSRAVLVHGQGGPDYFWVGSGECQPDGGANRKFETAVTLDENGQGLLEQCGDYCVARPTYQNNPGIGLFGFHYALKPKPIAGVFRECTCNYEMPDVVTYPVTSAGDADYTCYSVSNQFRGIGRDNNANAVGDPHFKTFNDIFFSYHGQCDLLLMWSLIHDVMIQIRTTRVDGRGHNSSFSYISEAALKIRDDIIEVTSSGSLLINGRDSTDSIPSFVSGSSLIKTVKGTKKHIVSYKVDLGGGRVIDLRSNTKASMVYVDVEGDFGEDTVGLLGSPGTEGLSSRDGIAYSMEFVNSYSESFQVLSDEPMLFQEARSPQYPEGCTYTATTNTAVSHLRRRLSDLTEVSKDEAMEACANAVPGEKMEFCVYDVMLTRDLDVAEDPSYSKHY